MKTATKKPVKKTAKAATKKVAKKTVKKTPSKNITERVTSFETACKELKISSKALPIVDGLPVKHQKAIVSGYKRFVIADALNEGWVANWDDSSEYKYYPWFFKTKAGFSFDGTNYGWTCTRTYGGSRHVFKTRALAEYFGKNFTTLHNDCLLM